MKVLEFEALKGEKGIGFSRGQIWRRVRAGTFPKPIKIGANRNAWVEDEIEAWLEGLKAARDQVRRK